MGTAGESEISILLLAAGSSSRMGESKQLLPVGNETLLTKAISTAQESGIGPITVVLGFDANVHQQSIAKKSIHSVVNTSWEKGIGNSIKAGLNFLIQKNEALKAVLIMVCDQPLLTADHLKSLLLEFQKSEQEIVATRYADTVGVPAIFRATLFNELLSIADEVGAKIIIQRHSENTKSVFFEAGSLDIDTPHDYQQLKNLIPS
jgi:molybdenum cofactor cytidylyltransferase